MIVNNKYRITSDPMNIILQVKSVNKTREGNHWRNEAFFSSYQSAFRYLVDSEIKATGLPDLKTVLDKIDELYQLINGLAKLVEASPEGVRAKYRGSKEESNDNIH